jgi:hypothetical protein
MDELFNLYDEKKKLEKSIGHLRKNNESLKATNSTIRKENKNLSKKKGKMTSAITDLKSQLKDASFLLKQTRTEVKMNEAECERLLKYIETLESKSKKLDEITEKITAKENLLNEICGLMNKFVADVKEDIDSLDEDELKESVIPFVVCGVTRNLPAKMFESVPLSWFGAMARAYAKTGKPIIVNRPIRIFDEIVEFIHCLYYGIDDDYLNNMSPYLIHECGFYQLGSYFGLDNLIDTEQKKYSYLNIKNVNKTGISNLKITFSVKVPLKDTVESMETVYNEEDIILVYDSKDSHYPDTTFTAEVVGVINNYKGNWVLIQYIGFTLKTNPEKIAIGSDRIRISKIKNMQEISEKYANRYGIKD